MIWFELLRRWWKPVVLALVVSVALYETYDLGATVTDHKWQERWSQRDADDAESQLAAEQAVRELEHTWQGRVDEARTERDVKVKAIEDGAARVADNASRLHSAAIKAERNACKATAGTEGRSAPPGNLLADVLNRVGERTAGLAEYADELRAALDECRGSWPR